MGGSTAVASGVVAAMRPETSTRTQETMRQALFAALPWPSEHSHGWSLEVKQASYLYDTDAHACCCDVCPTADAATRGLASYGKSISGQQMKRGSSHAMAETKA